MLRPQKLAKGPLKAFKGKGGKIVEHVNVIEDICTIQILGFVGPFSDALLFQRTEARP